MYINKKSTFALIFLTYACYFTNAYGQHVLPEFTGSWYTRSIYEYDNACFERIYSYEEQFQGDFKSAAEYFIAAIPLPSLRDCEWSDVKIDTLHGMPYGMPSTFPGTSDDWKQIIAKDGPHGARAYRRCLTQEGHRQGEIQIYFSPSYVCPKGSRRSPQITPSGDFNVSCTTTPAACRADVVGRDLSFSGFGFLGHVGFTAYENYPENSVLEVLAEPTEGVYMNSLKNFKHIPGSPFWGSKYELPNSPPLTIEKATSIVETGLNQGNYPFEYTMTWNWHAGSYSAHPIYNQASNSWENITTSTNAKFRCDSFVYYSYLAGAGLSIVDEYNMLVYPKTIWKSFLKLRDSSGFINTVNPTPRVFNGLLQENIMANLFASNDINILELDEATSKYVKSSQITRPEKLKYLWDLALKYKNNPEKFNYLIDCLDYLKPLELTPDLIQTFHSLENTKNKKHILSTLINAAQSGHDLLNTMPGNNAVNNIIMIQNFTRDILYQTKEKELLKYTLQLYSSIMPPENSRHDIQEIINKKENSDLLSEKDKALLEVDAIFSNASQMELYLKPFIDSLSKIKLHAICFKLANFDPSLLNEKNKNTLKHFLLGHKSLLTEKISPEKIREIPSCDWTSAYSTIISTSQKEKNKLMQLQK